MRSLTEVIYHFKTMTTFIVLDKYKDLIVYRHLIVQLYDLFLNG